MPFPPRFAGPGSSRMEPNSAWGNIGLTPRGIHKLKKGETEPRHTTVEALKRVWQEQKIEFNDQSDGSFQLNVNARVLWAGASVKSRHK